MKIMRCPEECGKQWRLKQGKLEWQKQKKEEKKEEKEKMRKEKKKKKRSKIIDVKKVVEEWEIWDEEEKAVKLEEEVKKLVGLKCLGRKQVRGC